MSAAYLVAGCRTPIGKFLGGLSGVSAPQLGAVVIAETLRRADVTPAEVDEVILGNVLSAGVGQAPARQAALLAGLPPTVAAVTINKVCGSGLKAVMLADQAIRCGDAQCIVAGGMENMSQAPHLLPGTRQGWRFGPQQALDHMQHDGLFCSLEQMSMGQQAEYIAELRHVSRADQDRMAAESHRRAIEATDAGRFEAEIVPVPVDERGRYQPGGARLIQADEGPRRDTSLERLAALPTPFQTGGTVTAGNASQLSDGAAAVLVVDEALARGGSWPWRAKIVATATSGVPPKEVFIAPVAAVEKVLAKASLRLSDIDLIEMNEAFAAQCLACARPLEIDPQRLNVYGGAIALGHPIGASGARVLVTLISAMQQREAQRGLAVLCLGGGNAVAMVVQREE